ncbi:polyubiquitin-like [Solea senegalensis]|uniref:Polyubiquitin-like n=1 Tax=Solea senegalensis TaxID=28829 RepID=A0AAV6QJL8_SOLSE|nr:polyubiquitin-like [Solea senegalensis]
MEFTLKCQKSSSIMEIIITMLNGSSCSLIVQPQQTVGFLKQLIQEKLQIPIERQRLVFVNGQRTDLSDDTKTIGSYGLQSGSRLSLLVTEPVSIQVFLRNEKNQLSTYDITPDETQELVLLHVGPSCF